MRGLFGWLGRAAAIVTVILVAATGTYIGVRSLAVPPVAKIWAFPHGEQANTGSNSHEQTNEGESVDWVWTLLLWLTRDAAGAFTAALAVLTAFLAIFTYRLWGAGEKQFGAVNRPKIRIKHVWLKGEIKPDERIYIQIVLVNSGVTDAILNTGTFKSVTLSPGQRIPPHFLHDQGSQPFGRAVIPPGVTFYNKEDYAIHGGVNAAELAHMSTGTRVLYVVGSIEYLDSDMRFRNTSFCRVLKFSDTGNRFYRHRDPDYEYED